MSTKKCPLIASYPFEAQNTTLLIRFGLPTLLCGPSRFLITFQGDHSPLVLLNSHRFGVL